MPVHSKSPSKRMQVAIFGRPNVGKSTLFNQLTGTRKAMVKDLPGVTRDVHRGTSDWNGVFFDIFDTAGVTEGGIEAWSQEIRKKALEACGRADKIVFVLDGKYGLNPEDKDLTQYVKRLKKPFLAVVNKLDDSSNLEVGLSEFFELGLENVIPASFEHKYGLDEILEWIVEGAERNIDEEDTRLRLAVVGKPNAGKSTLVNSILGESKVVVSPVAGTTVDSVELPFTRDGQEFLLIDTAGIRRGAQRDGHVERVSAYKAEQSVIEAQILMVVVDGLLGPTHQDSRIVEMALKHHRAPILVVNKVDAAEGKIPRFRETTRQKIQDVFHYYKDIPTVFISAKTSRGVDKLFEMVTKVWRQLNLRISTQEINTYFFEVIRQAPAPSFRGKDIKFYYITQTKQKPPSFMAFVNEPRGITNGYRRFITAKIKEHYDLGGIPVRLYPKRRRRGSVRASDVSYGHADTHDESFLPEDLGT